MSRKLKDHNGEEFERLRILFRLDKKDKFGNYFFLCKCQCGNLKETIYKNLKQGDCKSCGCLKNEIEKLSLPKLYPNLYKRWWGIQKRVNNKANASYDRYKHLDIDKDFLGYGGFKEFVLYMLKINEKCEEILANPKQHIDRIKNELGYIKGNIQIISAKGNMRKRKNTKLVSINNVEIPLSEAIEKYSKVNKTTVYIRINKGWDVESALNKPSHRGKPLHRRD